MPTCKSVKIVEPANRKAVVIARMRMSSLQYRKFTRRMVKVVNHSRDERIYEISQPGMRR
jgi:hypothetical protein